MICPIPNCKTEIGSGLIICTEHWQKLPPDLRSKLLWHHPDVAKARKTPVKPGAYEALLKIACGHLSLAEGNSR